MLDASILQPLLDRVRVDVTARKNAQGVQSWTREPITQERIAAHLGDGPARGVCPIKAGESTVMAALFDLDSHKGETSWDEMAQVAAKLSTALADRGLQATPFSSSGGNGIHLYLLWDTPQDAYSVRTTMADALAAIGMESGTKGVSKGQIEIFPKQDEVPADGFGNQFILPLANESVPLEPLLDLAKMNRGTPFVWAVSEPVPALTRPAPVAPTTAFVVGHDQLKAALDAIPNEGANELDYDDWRNVMFSLHSATGGDADGLALAHAFSARSTKYDPAFLDERVWPYINNDRNTGITANTLFAMARNAGWVEHAPSPTDFEDISAEPDITPPPSRFTFFQAADFASGPPPSWIIKNVLPKADIGIIYGDSGSGKTFFVLDMAVHIAVDTLEFSHWRGNKVHHGAVAYIAAEGAGGVKTRLKAVAQHYTIPLASMPIYVLGDAPNFTEAKDVKDVIAGLSMLPPVSVVVVDTYASVMPGGNENSGEDAGRVIAHCKAIHRATGALVLLVHHSGKDASKGARGWSGLRAAVDVEMEVLRGADEKRLATITKLKEGKDDLEGWGFTLDSIRLDEEDADGDAIMSCYVEPAEASRASIKASKSAKAQAEKPTGIDAIALYDFVVSLISAGENVAGDTVISVQRHFDVSFMLADTALSSMVDDGRVLLSDGQYLLPPTDDLSMFV